MWKSMLPRRQCASAPETEAPTSWLADEATANGVWHADEDEKRRQQEAAADAEHARQKSHHSAKNQQDENVLRNRSDGQVDCPSGKRFFLAAAGAPQIAWPTLQPRERTAKRFWAMRYVRYRLSAIS